jgi:hypothetical protein
MSALTCLDVWTDLAKNGKGTQDRWQSLLKQTYIKKATFLNKEVFRFFSKQVFLCFFAFVERGERKGGGRNSGRERV